MNRFSSAISGMVSAARDRHYAMRMTPAQLEAYWSWRSKRDGDSESSLMVVSRAAAVQQHNAALPCPHQSEFPFSEHREGVGAK